jgi:hypothetical protein
VKGGSFLGDARSRLLPLWWPARFFVAAAGMHVLAWVALALAGETWLQAPAAPGWPLAALHLLTLGVLVMSVIGASAQLLPVALRAGVPSTRRLAWIWWLLLPGVLVLVSGMAAVERLWLILGGTAVVVALGLWGMGALRSLRTAKDLPAVRRLLRIALASLLAALAAASALLLAWAGVGTRLHAAWLELHRVAAPLGFMGLLVVGLSDVLLPMFVLSETPAAARQQQVGNCMTAALVLALAAVVGRAFGLPAAAWGPSLVAATAGVALHLGSAWRCLRDGARQPPGPWRLLLLSSWAGLCTGLGLSALSLLELAVPSAAPRLGAAWGLALLGAWLLGIWGAMLQRVLPFLVSLHGSGRRAPTPTGLTDLRLLWAHAAGHLAALAGLALALLLDRPGWVSPAAAVGALGAACFAAFVYTVFRRRAAARPAVRVDGP